MRSFRLGGILAATAATLLCVLATPANSATAPVSQEPSSLTLLVWGPGASSRGVELRCDPPGGSHPQALAACEDLHRVKGDLGQLTSEPFACTMELRQVTAVAVGTWEGRTLRWHKQFSNPCVMRGHTGKLFDF